jgi:hypothetical protein
VTQNRIPGPMELVRRYAVDPRGNHGRWFKQWGATNIRNEFQPADNEVEARRQVAGVAGPCLPGDEIHVGWRWVFEGTPARVDAMEEDA